MHLALSRALFAPYIVALFDDRLAALPAVLQPIIQDGYLERKYEDFVEPHETYAALAESDTFEEHIGTTITKTRPGLKGPIQLMTDAALAADDGVLNNGVNPSDAGVEQYTLTPGTYEDGMDLDTMGTNFAIVNRFAHNVKTNSIQGIQTRDILARDTLISSYMAGASVVVGGANVALAASTGGAAGATASIPMDDLRGFREVIANGKLQQVGAGALAPTATVYPAGALAGSYQIQIVGFVTDANNATKFVLLGSGAPVAGNTAAGTRGNGVSGAIVAQIPVGGFAGQTVRPGDIIVSGDAPKQFLAGPANLHYTQLTSGNLLTQSQILDGKSWLEDQGMEPLDDGTYLLVGSSRSFRGLFGDADFKQAFQAMGRSPEFKRGRVSEYLGVTFLQTTQAPRIVLPNGTVVHIPMLLGKGCLLDATYAGMDYWAKNNFNDAYVTMTDGIAQVITPPIDRMRRKLKMSWITIRDMVAPTDVTVNSNIIMTAGSGRRKRSVMLPHGASV